MSDIIDDLKDLAASVKASGGGEYREYQIAMAAIAEIERLRGQIECFEADAMGRGAEHAMKSFREIKQEINNGPAPQS